MNGSWRSQRALMPSSQFFCKEGLKLIAKEGPECNTKRLLRRSSQRPCTCPHHHSWISGWVYCLGSHAFQGSLMGRAPPHDKPKPCTGQQCSISLIVTRIKVQLPLGAPVLFRAVLYLWRAVLLSKWEAVGVAAEVRCGTCFAHEYERGQLGLKHLRIPHIPGSQVHYAQLKVIRFGGALGNSWLVSHRQSSVFRHKRASFCFCGQFHLIWIFKTMRGWRHVPCQACKPRGVSMKNGYPDASGSTHKRKFIYRWLWLPLWNLMD